MNNEIIVVKQSPEIDELLILNEGAVWSAVEQITQDGQYSEGRGD